MSNLQLKHNDVGISFSDKESVSQFNSFSDIYLYQTDGDKYMDAHHYSKSNSKGNYIWSSDC